MIARQDRHQTVDWTALQGCLEDFCSRMCARSLLAIRTLCCVCTPTGLHLSATDHYALEQKAPLCIPVLPKLAIKCRSRFGLQVWQRWPLCIAPVLTEHLPNLLKLLLMPLLPPPLDQFVWEASDAGNVGWRSKMQATFCMSVSAHFPSHCSALSHTFLSSDLQGGVQQHI